MAVPPPPELDKRNASVRDPAGVPARDPAPAAAPGDGVERVGAVTGAARDVGARKTAARSPSPDPKTRTLGHAGDVDPVEAARWDRFGWVLRQMMWVCLVSHMLFLVVFSVVGVRSLVLVNVGSVSAYLVGVALLRRGRIRAAFVIGVVEVTVHAVAASIVLGWASGFHVYIPILAALRASTSPFPPAREGPSWVHRRSSRNRRGVRGS